MSTVAKHKAKEIGGNLYKRWSVWFNSIIREKSYQWKYSISKFLIQILTVNGVVGTAWLS